MVCGYLFAQANNLKKKIDDFLQITSKQQNQI